MSSMRQRVKERGKRKCLPVMGRIGVESQQDDIIPRESEQTSPWSHIARELEKPTQEAKQMTEAKATGAVSREPEGWYDIDLKRAYRNVRRLQARTVKATQEGRWNRVKALQRLLAHSYSAKVLAVKRVTENEGKRTPGVDGEVWDTPQKKAEAVHTLQWHGYHPQPLRRIYIPKNSDRTKKRPLSIPTMKDRAMQALYLMALDPIAETTADPNSYGFRKERSPADAIQQCYTILARKDSASWILEGDIRACFDRICHRWLLANIPMNKTILNKWLKAGYIERSALHPTEEGVPQGGIVSPVIANLALDGLEKMLQERYPKGTRRARDAKVHLVRFADDWLITGSSKELLENEIKPLVEQFLGERGLELSHEKTHITHIDDGFDFLGQNIRKYNGKLLIKPSRKSVERLLNRVRETIKVNQHVSAGLLIARLNPIIRGWSQYHRHVVSKDTFAKIDHAVFRAIWRWANRQHPNKGKRWVKKKYFKTLGSRNWVFYGDLDGKELHLFCATAVPIRRHIKIKGQANPYDPEWEIYFEKRLAAKMTENMTEYRQLLRLWEAQQGLCPICNQKITRKTKWHNHHIIWRSKGGPDSADNRILLHPDCHRKVDSQHLYVEKPRPAKGVSEA
jgi:RNA-directed DNA polymerase